LDETLGVKIKVKDSGFPSKLEIVFLPVLFGILSYLIRMPTYRFEDATLHPPEILRGGSIMQTRFIALILVGLILSSGFLLSCGSGGEGGAETPAASGTTVSGSVQAPMGWSRSMTLLESLNGSLIS